MRELGYKLWCLRETYREWEGRSSFALYILTACAVFQRTFCLVLTVDKKKIIKMIRMCKKDYVNDCFGGNSKSWMQ